MGSNPTPSAINHYNHYANLVDGKRDSLKLSATSLFSAATMAQQFSCCRRLILIAFEKIKITLAVRHPGAGHSFLPLGGKRIGSLQPVNQKINQPWLGLRPAPAPLGIFLD